MANYRFLFNTEAEILALTPSSPEWFDRAFYYPDDKDYFFQTLNGVMKKFAGGDSFGVGIKLNGQIIGGVKTLIETDEVLDIPENWDYNTYNLNVEGVINCEGQINTL